MTTRCHELADFLRHLRVIVFSVPHTLLFSTEATSSCSVLSLFSPSPCLSAEKACQALRSEPVRHQQAGLC